MCSASVAYFSYEQNNWREVESGAQGILELLNQKKDHSYKLSAKVAGNVRPYGAQRACSKGGMERHA